MSEITMRRTGNIAQSIGDEVLGWANNARLSDAERLYFPRNSLIYPGSPVQRSAGSFSDAQLVRAPTGLQCPVGRSTPACGLSVPMLTPSNSGLPAARRRRPQPSAT